MFSSAKAFSSFAVDDLAAAKQFYGSTLGLTVEDGPMGTATLRLPTGAEILIYPKPRHTPASFTILNIEVDDIDKAVAALAERGVTFERYEGFGQDDKGIARDGGPLIAWFTDPAGNVLSVLQVQ
jgi:predicted enzyme related to lactoylglutathione lyase